MADDRARELLSRLETMRGERSNYEAQWQEIAELMSPQRADFLGQRQAGEKRAAKIFDGAPGIAAENLAAGLWGMLTNSANAWFRLKSSDEKLNQRHEVKLWLDEVSRLMLDAFSAGGQRFYARALDLYSDLVHFGTGVFYVDEMPGAPELYFSCRHLGECFIAENDREQIDTLFRRFRWTARQAVARWGKAVPAVIATAAERDPERRFDFLHAVFPMADWGEKDVESGHRFASIYVAMDGASLLSQSGYFEFPYQVPRWSQRSRGVYGDSPAMLALADTKMLNQMARTTLVGAQKRVDPPLLAPDEGSLRGVRTTPGGIIYGGVDPQGRPLFHPLNAAADVGLGLQLEEQRRQAIREAFHATLLLMVAQPGRSATEVLALQEEKLRLMGPQLGRVQAEFLDPLIDRVFSLLQRSGRLPQPPASLVDQPELKISYVSPMALAQKASEANAIVRTLQAITPLAQFDPGVLENLNPDEAARALAEAFGLPSRLMRDPRQVTANRNAKSQQGALLQMAQLTKPVAGAVKDVSAAGKQLAETPDAAGKALSALGGAAGSVNELMQSLGGQAPGKAGAP